jgi:hypothetical protein
VNETLRWIEHTWLSTVIRQSSWAVMALEAVHLLGLALLGGAALITGIAAFRGDLRGISVGTFARGLWPMSLCGLILMSASGILIALSMPFKYYNNAAFQWKMLLLPCALVTTAFLSRESFEFEHARPTLQRALAVQALIFWLSVGFSGRLIGFL